MNSLTSFPLAWLLLYSLVLDLFACFAEMTETLTTQVSSPSAQCTGKPLLSSDLEAFAAASSTSELDHVTCDLVNQPVQDSYKSESTPVQLLPAGHMAHTPVMQPDQSPGSRCRLTPSMDLGHGYVSKSSPLLSASGSPTPATPQSHCSASSPLSQQAFADVASVTLPPPPYASGTLATDHTMMPPGISSQSPSPIDQAKPGMPPPPKKPLTPYMRFSKSVSFHYNKCSLTRKIYGCLIYYKFAYL